MKIIVHDPSPGALLRCGLPLAAGRLRAGGGLSLTDVEGRALPLWWETRARWPDGSVRWIYLHARLPATGLPAGEISLVLAPAGPPPAGLPPLDGSRFVLEDVALSTTDDGFTFAAPGITVEVAAGGAGHVGTDPCVAVGRPGPLELVEASPIAPLLRWRQAETGGGGDVLRFDHLFRLDPVAGTLHWQQRLCFHTGQAVRLQRLTAHLRIVSTEADLFSRAQGARPWHWPALDGPARRLLVRRPGVLSVDDGPERSGYPEARVEGAGGALLLEKGWQRAPFALTAVGAAVEVEVWPAAVDALTVQPGTSFRHTFHIGREGAGFAPLTWSLEAAAACSSGAFGPLMPRSQRTQKWYPGYEQAIDAALHSGRLSGLDKERGGRRGAAADLLDEAAQDEEYFGLQHYGDWPMGLGAYGGERRMYADNEYDTPYAYFLQFVRTGNPAYLEVAHHAAVHMADVDSMVTTGDMRFHGYRETAEDHAAHRTAAGDLGHYWTDGLVLNYLLCGDLWSWEAARAQVDHLVQVFAGEDDDAIRRHFLGCERAVGWPLVALAGVAEVTGDERLQAKMRQMTAYLARFTADPDRELEEVDTIGGVPIRWWRTGQADGCKPFMLGVVLEGLERHHRLTGDPAAAAAIVAISRFLVEVMWVENVEAFIYEWNAFNRAHREEVYPHYINMMVAPGLACAFELTGEAVFRQVATRCFHAALWTLFAPGGGKEIGMVGRTSALTVGRLYAWRQRDEAAAAARLPPSHGLAFTFEGPPEALAGDGRLVRRQGVPCYREGALICAGDSFAVYGFREPACTDSGFLAFTVTPDWDCPPRPGPVAQRAYLHLCDTPFTASCLSVISFYTGLHVRFHDARRQYIEVLEADIQDWRAGEAHRVEIGWRTGQGSSGAPGDGTAAGDRAGTGAAAWLRIDGVERDRRPLPRRLSGGFKRLHLGHRPGNWRAEGTLSDLIIRLGGGGERPR